MYTKNKRLKTLCSTPFVDDSSVHTTCVNLGTRIRDQMYTGVDSSNSTLVTGQYDDDDNWEVDPACDMSTDRFTLDIKERVPDVTPTPTSTTE